MKKIYNYIMLFILAFVAVCCSEEEPIQTPSKSGGEVQFGLSLENLSRTIYGEESNNAFPIYWVNDDKVMVYSPQCATDRNLAEYKVSVNGTQQNYATSLTKTGSYGIQWGDEVANFYSVYPSGDYTVSGEKIRNLKIGYSQDVYLAEDGVTLKNMSDCLMHAVVNNVAVGTTVNLTYNPIATAIMLHLNVPSSSTVGFTIQSIKLTAPTGTNIAGDFNVNLADGTFAEWVTGSSSNSITLQISNSATGGFYQMAKESSIIVPIFLVPVNGLDISGWTIDIITDQGTFKKKLTRTDDGKTALKAGMVHNLTLPNLTIEKETEWQVANWMVNIPRNVYLSEVSIPGSWNSINPDFQDTGTDDATTIANQYAQGVRAFHLDTRWKAKYSGGFIGLGQTVTVVGLGVADGGDNGSATSSLWTSGDKYMRGDDTPLVEDIISQLVGYIKNTPEEYMVLVCSFAQESIEHNGTNGWIKEISTICSKDEYKDYVVNAQNVTPNTLVGDVLGKIVVLIASSEKITDTTTPSSTLAENSRCFFSYMPQELQSTQFGENSSNMDELWFTTTTTNDSGITLYNSHAQITSSTGSAITDHNRGYVPSINQRTAVLNRILNWSKSNYGTENYKHDKWIYLGLGGYQVEDGGNAGSVNGSYSTIASTYNTWINGKVTEMGITPQGQTSVIPYYPVGIVLMNYVNDYVSTVKNILQLNSKYRLQYDPDKPANYNPNAKAISEYDTSLTTGGKVFSLD